MAKLTPEDQETLDLLVEQGFQPAKLPEANQRRAGNMCRMLEVLESEQPISGVDLLVQRTLAAAKAEIPEPVKKSEQTTDSVIAQIRMAPDPQALRPTGTDAGGIPIRLRDVIGVAAMILVIVSVGWPVIHHAGLKSRQLGGQANMQQIAMGLDIYADHHDNLMPVTDGPIGNSWWHPDPDASEGVNSNSAHLFHLTKKGYVDPKYFNDPGNPDGTDTPNLNAMDWSDPAHVSYSYQNQFDGEPDFWVTGVTRPILADKNPHFAAGKHKELHPDTDSRNHGDLGGQNVLYSDGHVRWHAEPVTAEGDHIYLHGHEHDHLNKKYQGNELPASDLDTFLVW